MSTTLNTDSLAPIKRAHLITNLQSGSGFGAQLHHLARQTCEEAGYYLVIHSSTDANQFQKQIEKAVQEGVEDPIHTVVIAAGGDGTIRSVAQVAQGQKLRFAIVPIGTFNFFARDNNIPEDPEQALRIAMTGSIRQITVAEMNGQVFLNNASLGLYVRSIIDREQQTKRWGRKRLVVALAGILSLFNKQKLLSLEIDSPHEALSDLKTPMIFIGNNALQLRDLAFQIAEHVDQDLLALILMKPLGRWEMMRILYKGLAKQMHNEASVDTYVVRTITIHSRNKSHDVALDGEIFHLQTPLKVRVLKKSLSLVCPHEAPPS